MRNKRQAEMLTASERLSIFTFKNSKATARAELAKPSARAYRLTAAKTTVPTLCTPSFPKIGTPSAP
jgi:hypothetical protein